MPADESRAATASPEIDVLLEAWAHFLAFWGEDASLHVAKARRVLGNELTDALLAAVEVSRV